MVEKLIVEAIQVQQKAYSPYSNFIVGAALLGKSGKIYTGCNIESVSFAPTICAERTAIAKAVSEGEREFEAIAVVGKPKEAKEEQIEYISPCGVCRQTLVEFCKPNFKIYLAKSTIDYKEYTMEELLPCSFSSFELLDI